MATIRLCCGDERSPLTGCAGSRFPCSGPSVALALKLRSLLRYRRLPFDWVPASLDWTPPTLGRPAISALASRAIDMQRMLPVVYFADDRAYRDHSTFVAYALEHAGPSEG